jgi:exopolysaccharide production protein ExoY
LRKSSLDELPQLINVLREEMSCVGPRPIVVDELQRYGPHAILYLQARPGLTGIWQVSGRNALDYADRVALDCRYVRNWSLWNDLVILGKTVLAVMKFDEAA